jgi:hypothetical protein
MFIHLTVAERQALRCYAAKFPRAWRTRLRGHAWLDDAEAGFYAPALRQLLNRAGRYWLRRARLR